MFLCFLAIHRLLTFLLSLGKSWIPLKFINSIQAIFNRPFSVQLLFSRLLINFLQFESQLLFLGTVKLESCFVYTSKVFFTKKLQWKYCPKNINQFYFWAGFSNFLDNLLNCRTIHTEILLGSYFLLYNMDQIAKLPTYLLGLKHSMCSPYFIVLYLLKYFQWQSHLSKY